MTKSFLLGAILTSALALGLAAAFASDTHVTGQLCGVKACVDLPTDIAVKISQRDDAFSPAARPKPLPYYKIVVKTDGAEGYVPARVIWVPAKHRFRVKYDVTPPLAAYWRTGDKEYEAQFTQAVHTGALKPFPASRRYK